MPFLFTVTATTEIYTLSLHDALPICEELNRAHAERTKPAVRAAGVHRPSDDPARIELDPVVRRSAALPPGDSLVDRKSTRLNSSHTVISYAVFCLKKKKTNNRHHRTQ